MPWFCEKSGASLRSIGLHRLEKRRILSCYKARPDPVICAVIFEEAVDEL